MTHYVMIQIIQNVRIKNNYDAYCTAAVKMKYIST